MIQRREWHWVEWVLFIIQLGWFVLGIIYMYTSPEELAGNSRLVFFVGIFIVFLVPMIFWRPNYTNPFMHAVAVLLTAGTLQLYLTYVNQKPISIIDVPLMVIGFLSERKLARWTAPACVLLLPIADFFIIDEYKIGDFFGQLIGGVLLFGIGLSLQRVVAANRKAEKLLAENQRQYQLIHEQNNALEQYANQIEQLTLVEERNRMARELHDTVGHTFTSVIMGMDAVSYLIESSPDKAKEKLDKLRTVTRNGLEEVRRSIHQMASQGDDMLLSLQLARLANEFALHTGTQVRIQTAGEEFELPKQMKLTLIRCLQESLTNSKRHGRASVVEVILTYEEHQVSLKVEDDGIGTEQLQRGFGIRSMQDRISSLQGILAISSASGQGTTVHCSIPARRFTG